MNKYPNALIVSPSLYKKLKAWGYDMYWYRKWKKLPLDSEVNK